MITNHLLLKIKDPSTDNISKAAEVLRSMQGRIEYLRTLQVETDIRRGPESYDILLVAGFDSMQDFNAYLTHPVHAEVAAYIGSVVEHVASVCYRSNQ